MTDLPRTAEALPRAFEARFNARDLDGVLELYEPDAILLETDGTALQRDGLAASIARHLERGIPIDMRPRHILEAGGVALYIVDWKLSGEDEHGTPVETPGTATDVARRGADGVWRYLIDNPDVATPRRSTPHEIPTT